MIKIIIISVLAIIGVMSDVGGCTIPPCHYNINNSVIKNSGMCNYKECRKCGENKPTIEFNKGVGYKDKLNTHCKECTKKRLCAYSKTKDGVISRIYRQQKTNSKRRNHPMPSYSMIELKEWMLSKKIFHDIFNNWVDFDYSKMLKPSIDRLNDYNPYTFDNIRITTWEGNSIKAYSDVRNGINNKWNKRVVGTSIKNGDVISFHSAAEANRKTGINPCTISNCCNKKQLKYKNGNTCIPKSAGGYVWKFDNKI